MSAFQFVCKCIACGKKFEMTQAQIKEAETVGCPMSPCCGHPATLERATVRMKK